MSELVMTSIKLPKQTHQKMLEKIISDGYGMKGKSRWIVEAITNFLALQNFHELVDIATDISDVTEMVTIRLPNEVAAKIDKAIIAVRKCYPAMEGVKSHIIRASIMQRFIRG
jgi:predicted transcriptional regulator